MPKQTIEIKTKFCKVCKIGFKPVKTNPKRLSTPIYRNRHRYKMNELNWRDASTIKYTISDL